MVPRIAILDADTSAARVTRSLVAHILPAAHVTIVRADLSTGDLTRGAPPDILIVDPAGGREAAAQVVRALKQVNPALSTVLLTSDSPARCARQTHNLAASTVLEKTAPPAVLLDQLRLVVDDLVRKGSGGDESRR